MGKRHRNKLPQQAVVDKTESKPSSSAAPANAIKVWKPEKPPEMLSSVARQMQAQGIPIPPGVKIVNKGMTGASQIPVDESLARWRGLYPERPHDTQARMKMREGKKTWVCMGTAPDSCGLAPWHEPGIVEWVGLNDAHQLAFMHMDKMTRWCQVHQKGRYMRKNPRYDIDHWAWLQKKHPFPIYMQRHDPEVPSSVPIPLREFCEKFIAGKIARGQFYNRIVDMGSTFSYIIPMAMMEGAERIEFYGVELAQEVEYIEQRPSFEFWAGFAAARGVEIYVPEITRVLKAHFYGYDHPKPDETWPKEWRKMENNAGDWTDFPDMNAELLKHIIPPGNWPKASEAWLGQFESSVRNATE